MISPACYLMKGRWKKNAPTGEKNCTNCHCWCNFFFTAPFLMLEKILKFLQRYAFAYSIRYAEVKSEIKNWTHAYVRPCNFNSSKADHRCTKRPRLQSSITRLAHDIYVTYTWSRMEYMYDVWWLWSGWRSTELCVKLTGRAKENLTETPVFDFIMWVLQVGCRFETCQVNKERR